MVCWIVVAIVLVLLAVWFLTGSLFGLKTGLPTFSIGSFDNLTGPYNEAGSYTVTAEGVDSLTVTWVAGEASITPYDGDVVKITEFARRDLKENEKLVYTVNGSKLDIRYSKTGFTINTVSKKLELLVPRALAAKLDTLEVSATSADVKISDFSAKTFSVHETSGTTAIANVKARAAAVNSVSGEIGITGLTTDQLTLGTVSGGITLTGVTSGSVKSGTTSGNQLFNGSFSSLEMSTVSGEMTAASSVMPEKITASSTSGTIVMTLPKADSMAVTYSTTSGKFTSDIPVKNSGGAPYKFSTVSGDIHVKAA